MREKASEDKITDLKKQHETPENCSTLSETKVNQGVWNNLDESARSTDLKFQKVQKSLVMQDLRMLKTLWVPSWMGCYCWQMLTKS